MRIPACLLAVLLLAGSAIADTYLVLPDGTGDFPTIQEAIDSVSDGDVIELADGTFTGEGNRDLDYQGKAIEVRSQSGNPELCVVDCEGAEADPHRGIVFESGEGHGSILTGVTVTNGWITERPYGGGIRCSNGSSPTIDSCIFFNNRNSAILLEDWSAPTLTDCYFFQNHGWQGGALCCKESSPAVRSCRFSENTADLDGGAVSAHASSPLLVDCLFRQNFAGSAGAVNAYCGGEPVFTDCLFIDNSADHDVIRLYCFIDAVLEGCTSVGNSAGYGQQIVTTGKMTYVHIEGCTFCGNSAPNGGVILASELHVTIENTIIAFSPKGKAIMTGDSATLTCCNIFGNEGGDWDGYIAGQYGINGNIAGDPRFCGRTDGSIPMIHEVASAYSLHANSPCLPGNHPDGYNGGLIGAHGQGCGLSIRGNAAAPQPLSEPAALEVDSWGRFKSLFR